MDECNSFIILGDKKRSYICDESEADPTGSDFDIVEEVALSLFP